MVVATGMTVVLVPTTGPTPWSIESVVAPVTVQASTVDPPTATDGGVAVKDEMVGGTGAPTVRTSATVVAPAAFEPVTV